MQQVSAALVAKVRSVSRDLVRELGFMNRTLAGTDLPPSAVHAIIEIGAAGKLSAKDLGARLLLEKSTISRLVRSLDVSGVVRELRSKRDRRIKYLQLTRKGNKTLASITGFAEQQVAGALSLIDQNAQRNILSGLETYSAALRASRNAGETAEAHSQPTISTCYKPGLIGRIVEMHATSYSKLVGFGAPFETKVAGDLAEFVTRLVKPENEIWSAESDGEIVGSVAIDGEDLGNNVAHLRWFIVESRVRGAGLGKRLIRQVVDYCNDRGFPEVHLWTFKGLDAARSLYERNGFVLAEEYLGDQWGSEILEQRFVRLTHS